MANYYYSDAELLEEQDFYREVKNFGITDHHGEDYVQVELPDTFEGDLEELGTFIFEQKYMHPQDAIDLYLAEVYLGDMTERRTR